MTNLFSDYSMTINGQSVAGDEFIEVVNPATGKAIAKVPNATKAQFESAVKAANDAFPQWRDTPIEKRKQMLLAVAGTLATNNEDFAKLFTMEQGRPLDGAMQEVMGAAFWCQQVSQMEIPVQINEDTEERRSETYHVPLGVVGAIVPWNFPLLLAIWKIAPALLAGNTLVVKPSPFTPLTMMKLAELLKGILPAGVLNVVTGGDNLGPWITSHPEIHKTSFTGSTATGKLVMASAAENLQRVTLELGGNDAAIVMPDVDVDEIVPDIFWSAFKNSGQICIATKRLYVHEDIYDNLATALVNYAKNHVNLGNGLEPTTNLGPVQNKRQFERVKNLIEDTKKSGLKFHVESEIEESDGFFIPVHIVDNPPEDSKIVQEEPFGPILPMLKFKSLEEAIEKANTSEYGLAGSVWTKDLDLGRSIARKLETGTVWVNEFQYIMPWTPFAGHKSSGIGVENGLDGILEYTVPQTISIKK